jgi:hypothetical protein
VSSVFLTEIGIPSTQTGALTLQTYDVELTKQFMRGDLNLTGFAGVRWAMVHQRSDVQGLGFPLGNSALSYNGIGPTAGLEGDAALLPGGPWSIYFAGRGSFLYGKQTDSTNDLIGLYTFGYRAQNSFASSWELNVGPQWKTPVAGLNHNDFSGGFGLLGFTAAVGISR